MSPINLFTASVSAFAVIALSAQQPATAGSRENACAIWLCLPAGFSLPGCGKAKTAWLDRLADFKPPLPSWSSCSANPNSTGSFTTGREPYQACNAGYTQVQFHDNEAPVRSRNGLPRIEEEPSASTLPVCVRTTSCRNPHDVRTCPSAYTPAANPTPEWVEMVIDGKNVGRFNYARP